MTSVDEPLIKELRAIQRMVLGEEVPDEERSARLGVSPRVWEEVEKLANIVEARVPYLEAEVKRLKDALGEDQNDLPMNTPDVKMEDQNQDQDQDQEQDEEQEQKQKLNFSESDLNDDERDVVRILAMICGQREGDDVTFEAAPVLERAKRAKFAASMVKYLANQTLSSKQKRLAGMVYAIGHVGAAVTLFGVRPEKHWREVKQMAMDAFVFWMRTGRTSADREHPAMTRLWLIFLRLVRTLAAQTPEAFDVGLTLDLGGVVYQSMTDVQRIALTDSSTAMVFMGNLHMPPLNETAVRIHLPPGSGHEAMRLVAASSTVLDETAKAKEGPTVVSANLQTTTGLADEKAEVDAAREYLQGIGLC